MSAGAYSGALYRTRGPAYDVVPWTGTVTATQVGRRAAGVNHVILNFT